MNRANKTTWELTMDAVPTEGGGLRGADPCGEGFRTARAAMLAAANAMRAVHADQAGPAQIILRSPNSIILRWEVDATATGLTAPAFQWAWIRRVGPGPASEAIEEKNALLRDALSVAVSIFNRMTEPPAPILVDTGAPGTGTLDGIDFAPMDKGPEGAK